jgi:hypothetical protein
MSFNLMFEIAADQLDRRIESVSLSEFLADQQICGFEV